jgi:hypothetical protein
MYMLINALKSVILSYMYAIAWISSDRDDMLEKHVMLFKSIRTEGQALMRLRWGLTLVPWYAYYSLVVLPENPNLLPCLTLTALACILT